LAASSPNCCVKAPHQAIGSTPGAAAAGAAGFGAGAACRRRCRSRRRPRGLHLHRLAQRVHRHVHALQGGQGHALDFERLDRGADHLGVLLEPELHSAQVADALVDFLGVERGRDPLPHAGQAVAGALDQALQEVEAGDELGEGGGVGHGGDLLIGMFHCAPVTTPVIAQVMTPVMAPPPGPSGGRPAA
jgi:hypothetical protein